MNVIEIRNISKQYPKSGKKANNNISLDLKKGEILCIAGENGAGKTTLMKILCALEKHDSGDIRIKGNIGMVHQHFMLFPEFTAAENIVIGKEPRKFGIFTDNKKACQISEKIISDNNFSVKPNVKVKELTLTEMQQVEICRILYRNADIIILDEPTSILTELEIKSLFITLKNLANNGKSIILITHKLHEIKQISDRVAVLHRGELAGIRSVRETDAREIAGMMMGENIKSEKNEDAQKPPTFVQFTQFAEQNIPKEPVITFENVTVRRPGQKLPLLDNVSFCARSGEILGFAGVGGNGLGVIEAVLGGFLHPASGKVFNREKDITRFSIRALRKQGLAYVPADRVHVGSAAGASIKENFLINELNRYYEKKPNQNKITQAFKRKTGALNDMFKNAASVIRHNAPSWIKNSGLTAESIDKYNIDAPDINADASTLSGGNLQKLILAREIDCLKDYIVFSNPTWGLDIESSRFVLNEIAEIRKKGAAVILISTDLDEIITLADRIIVMFKGRISSEYSNNDDNELKVKIGKSMQGITRNDE